MQTTHPDAFALKNSGLDAFLYADVGVELNGSPLTILSMLARLGTDPWAQAAGWAAVPTAAAIDGLSQSIAQMPLAPAVLAGSRDIAVRLVQLLPGKPRRATTPATAPSTRAAASEQKATAARDGSLVMVVWCGVAVWMVLSMLLMPKPATDIAASMGTAAGTTAASHAPTPRHATARPAASPAPPHRTPVSD